MGALTDTLENELLDHVFAKGSFSAPAEVYLGLFTTLPSDDGTGGVEYAGYDGDRQAMASKMGTASSGTISNSSAFSFENFDAEKTVVGVGVWSASSGGTMYWYGALTANKTVALGDTFVLQTGALDFSLD